MKKSYLIFLLCLLFCGQMFGQKPPLSKPTIGKNTKVVKPTIGKNPDAPTMLGVTENSSADDNSEPCLTIGAENYQLLEIDDIYWNAEASDLLGIINASGVLPPDPMPLLPSMFNIVVISLNHPANFEEYEFNISVEQYGSPHPVFILFIDDSVTTDTNNGVNGIKGFTIVNNGSGNPFNGGVATVVPVQTVTDPYITIHTEVKQVVLTNGDNCSLNGSTTSSN